MRSPASAKLQLSVVSSDGTDRLFDGSIIDGGVHLRWAFVPELGFPNGGFHLYRRRHSQTEFGLERRPWELVDTLNLPYRPPLRRAATEAEKTAGRQRAVARLARTHSNPRLAGYWEKAAELVELIDYLRPDEHYNSIVPGAGGTVSLRALDMLLLGSLDPYVARMLGLYYIDTTVSPGEPVDYYIAGDWRNGRWPLKHRRFEGRQIDTGDESPAGRWHLQDVDLVTSRAAKTTFIPGANQAEDSYQLELSGSSSLPLRLIFPDLVEEVEIDLVRSAGTPRWRAIASSFVDDIHADQVFQIGVDGGSRLRSSAGGLAITADHGFGFERLDLYDDAGNSTWRITGVGYRQHVEPITLVESDVVYVHPPAITTPFIRRDVVADRPVSQPRVAVLERTVRPPALDAEGNMPVDTTTIEVTARSGAPNAHPNGPVSPVRLHVNRAKSSSPEAALTLTDPASQFEAKQSLLGCWRFDGNSQDSCTPGAGGHHGTPFGSRPQLFYELIRSQLGAYATRQAIYLVASSERGRTKGGFVRVELDELSSLGSYLRLQSWVKPQAGQISATLVGRDYRRSFWFGLQTAAYRAYRLRFWINGEGFSSVATIDGAERYWSLVGVEYDGSKVRFFIDGTLDSEHDASLGPVRTADNILCIGADSTASDADDLGGHYPYSGSLADTQLWTKSTPRPSPTNPRLIGSLIPANIGPLVDALPFPFNPDLNLSPPASRSAFRDGALIAPRTTSPIDTAIHLVADSRSMTIANLAKETVDNLSIKFSVNPEPGQEAAVLLDGKTFRVELRPEGSDYRLHVSVAGETATFDTPIASDDWSEVELSIDADKISATVNGAATSSAASLSAALLIDPTVDISVGSGIDIPADINPPFRGRLDGVHLWDAKREPASPVVLRSKSSLPADYSAADYMDFNVADGTYQYRLQGIDLFGRTSEWSPPDQIQARDVVPPPTPVNIGAQFKALSGSVLSIDDTRLTTDIDLPVLATPFLIGDSPRNLFKAAALLRNDAVVSRFDDGELQPPRSQPFEIRHAEVVSGQLVIELADALLPILIPTVGDSLTIELDATVRLRWAWTGMQRLTVPKAAKFHTYIAQAPATMVDGQPTWPAQLDAWQWGAAFSEQPFEAPASFNSTRTTPVRLTRLSLADKQRMFDDATSPILWMPGLGNPEADDKHRVYSLRIPDVELPASSSPDAANYVSAAIVGLDSSGERPEWRSFPVVWHEPSSSGGLTVYIHDEDRERTANPQLSKIRFYPGVAYQQDIPLRSMPSFMVWGIPQPSRDFFCTVTAIDSKGSESEKTSAKLVAVDRRRPLPAPQPIVALGERDYYGNAPAVVDWEIGEERALYRIHRATDSDICTRDSEQRRRKLGYYAALPEADVFGDDADFADWLPTVAVKQGWPELIDDWVTLLFAPMPGGVRRGGEMPADAVERTAWLAWDRATPVWRAWSDRFYTSRIHEEFHRIAQRGGNETAFALVSTKPVEASPFVDSVNGRVRNSYFYRLRSQSIALNMSSSYGPVSAPTKIDYTDPPKAPIITDCVVGDRSFDVAWSLNRSPNIAVYELYRTDSAEELEDLRSWTVGADSRIIATIDEPLLRAAQDAAGRAVFTPPAEFAEILGVYRLDDFDATRLPVSAQPQAFDYFDELVDAATVALRPIAEGTALAVVFRSFGGEELSWTEAPSTVPYRDDDIDRVGDYFYRVVTVDKQGVRSAPSKTQQLRVKDSRIPEPPLWSDASLVLLDADDNETIWDGVTEPAADEQFAMRLTWQSLDHDATFLCSRRARLERNWKPISAMPEVTSLGDDAYLTYDRFVDQTVLYEYRIKVISATGVPSLEYSTIHAALHTRSTQSP